MKTVIRFTFEGQVGGDGAEAAKMVADDLSVAAAVSLRRLPTQEELRGLAEHLREVAAALEDRKYV